MQGTKIATRYAKSLIDLSLEKGQLENVNNDMKMIASSCNDNYELALLLKSPIIKPDKKEAILDAIWGKQLNEITKEFIKIIVRKKRELYLAAIADAFNSQYRKHKNILRAVITTAHGLDESLKSKVMEIVKSGSASEVELVEKTDPTIIGGFILRVGDKQDDTSIKSKINKLNRTFKENPYIKDY